MIDQDKMRALAAKLRGPLAKFDNFAAGYSEAADAIDLLLVEVEALGHDNGELVKAANAEATLAEQLRAELEAAAADKRDGHRYRELLGLLLAGDIPMPESSVSLNVCGVPPNQGEFDEAVDFLLAQRQGEGS